MSKIIRTSEYKDFIHRIKSKIQSSQIKASIKVNVEMLKLYWSLAEDIVEKQKTANWGDGLIKQISQDLKDAFPHLKGFSIRNIKYMRQWYCFWIDEPAITKQLVSQIESLGKSPQLVDQINDEEKGQQLVAQIFQIPWGQNIVIMAKCKSPTEALFYINQTIENNWSRAVLVHQIESDLYQRKGKSITNFQTTLPKPQSDLANQLLKDPYTFDFLNLTAKHSETELENALTQNVAKLLLELGVGFSYIGEQYRIEVDNDDFFIDLLFYHTKLHSYIVVELKTVKFKPEFAGKLNFYVTAVDEMMRTKQDYPTIGILICKSKNNIVVEYAIKDINKPISVSEYIITKELPEYLQAILPSVKDIEAELVDSDENGEV